MRPKNFTLTARQVHRCATAILQDHLHADDHGFLTDVEMAEAADQPHAVELARPLLEAADQQHVVIELLEMFGVAASSVRRRFFLFFGAFRGVAHAGLDALFERGGGRDCGFGKVPEAWQAFRILLRCTLTNSVRYRN